MKKRVTLKNGFKWLLLLELALIVSLQSTFWSSSEGIQKVWELEQEIAQQQQLLNEKKIRNQMLSKEIDALKSDSDALEEKARLDLGLIREGETFFHLKNE